MDSIKGAIMLRQRFESGAPLPLSETSPAADEAPPIFHWIAAAHAPEISPPPSDPET